jgi:hypothetical protein
MPKNTLVTLNHPVDQILSESSRRKIDPSKVPAELHPHIPIIQKWSGVVSDGEKYQLMDLAQGNPVYMQELRDWLATWTEEHKAAYNAWDKVSKLDSKNYEFCKFYFMGMVLDGIGLSWPPYS